MSQDPPRAERFLSRHWVIVLALISVVAVVSAVLFLTGAIGGADDEPRTTRFEVPTEPIEGIAGESLAWYQHGGRGDVAIVERRWEDGGTQPPSGDNEYLVLELRITSTEGHLTINPLYVSVLDEAGEEIFLAPFAGYTPELATTTLPAGEVLEVNATFELPPGDALLVLTEENFTPVLLIDVPFDD